MKNDVLDGGEAIVEALRHLGIDFVISSPGSEWGPLWEAFARQSVHRTAGPRYLSCWHETLAVDVAVGYTMITGRMQAVVLHAGAGLLQGAMGIQAARLSGIPMMVMSGESLTYGEREGFDPGAQWYASLGVVGGPQRLIEPLVKWGSQAPSPEMLYEMVIRAGELAQRSPKGPTYLNVPLETMLHPWTKPTKLRVVSAAPKPQASAPDIARVAALVAKAKNPVITTESCGREADGYDALVKLAERFAIPVVESSVTASSNFPKDHPLHQGFDINPFLKEADLVLIVRNRVPWYPPGKGPLNATVVVIDEAPLKAHMVYQNLQADVYLEGDVPSALQMLYKALAELEPDAAVLAARRSRWAARHEDIEKTCRAAEAEARGASAITSVHLSTTLGEVLPGNAIYVDETTSHRGRNQRHIPYRGPGSYIRTPSGLGQGLGLSLGVKLASPDRPVVSLFGDGSFLYNPTLPALGFARDEKLPIMIVVYNNRGYRAMRNNHLSYYPKGVAAQHRIFLGETLNGPDYHELAKMFGGVGISVQDPAELKQALEQGYSAVRQGKLAIVNVSLDA